MQKTCSCCKVSKPVEEFGKQSRKPDGLMPWCKICKRQHDNAKYNDKSTGRAKRIRANDAKRIAANMAFRDQLFANASCMQCGSAHNVGLYRRSVTKDPHVSFSEMIIQGHNMQAIQERIKESDFLCHSCGSSMINSR